MDLQFFLTAALRIVFFASLLISGQRIKIVSEGQRHSETALAGDGNTFKHVPARFHLIGFSLPSSLVMLGAAVAPLMPVDLVYPPKHFPPFEFSRAPPWLPLIFHVSA